MRKYACEIQRSLENAPASLTSRVGLNRGRRGQSLILITLMLFALLALAAVVMDGGITYTLRRKAQNAADAAAMAGARLLTLDATDAQIKSAINEYALSRNGAITFTATYSPGGQLVGGDSVPLGATGVQVTARLSSITFFASILGSSKTTAPATANASFGAVSQPGPNLQPMGTKCLGSSLPACGFNYGQTYDIWQGGGAGNFGWLSWNGATSATYLYQELTQGHVPDYSDPHGMCDAIATGCWVQGLPGVSNKSQVRDELDKWIARGTANPPVPLITVIFDTSEGNGSSVNYHIVGFAAFIIQSYDLSSGNINGKFVKSVISAPVAVGNNRYGVLSVHLTK
jgi:Flp pilus assembly protein TadG